MKILTIGGYGFDENTFVSALKRAEVDTFVDVRQRRGLRGRRYAFLNSLRLQHLLNEAGIRYIYLPELAPTTRIRELQKKQDDLSDTLKRERTHLSSEFTDAYRKQILLPFEAHEFLDAVGSGAQVVALFCVEGQPEACHRSLIAQDLSTKLGAQVEHIRP